MKNNRVITIICVLFAMAGRTFADNLNVENVVLQVGETQQVIIVLNNSEKQYAAFQFDLVLPAGVSIAEDINGKLLASLNPNRTDDHSLKVSKKGEGVYRFMSFSMGNIAFSGTSGVLVDVTLTADNNLAKTAQATITSQVFTEPNGTQYKLADATFTIGKGGDKCAAPTIAYDCGELVLESITEGAECHVSISTPDAGEQTGARVVLTPTYTITAWATAEGYADSDRVTATISWRDGRPVMEGFSSVRLRMEQAADVNGDSQVGIGDIVAITNNMAGVDN